ncbi:MAG TPA: type III pantothenate kinase [Pyrinomonadaceae bacterium]|nr:type III pantothenate kinase [Pyrinomonadaceae bacterium]
MFLAVDIGNSSIKFGVFDHDELTTKFFIPTKHDYTADEIAKQVGNRLDSSTDAAIVCSVVPEMDQALSTYLSHAIGAEPRFVKTSDDFGLTFNSKTEGMGTDRLVNSFAAARKYGVPVIVVSFGTATTFDVINANREYLGGLIAPGINVTVKALASAASKLPEVDLIKPERVIAKTTETAIQSGVIYGHIAMVEGLLGRVASELNNNPKVVATGGFAELIAREINAIDIVDTDLTLEGLMMLDAGERHGTA